MQIFDIKDELNGLFLFFLAIMSSFTFKLLGCPLQKLLANNLYARHGVYIAVILFTTSFSTDNKVNPIYHLINAFLIYIFIIIFTKMTVPFTIAVFILLIFLYLSHMYRNYYDYIIKKSSNKEHKKIYENRNFILSKIDKLLLVLIISITIFGSVKFILHKQKQYGKKFSIQKYFFGKRKCNYS